MEPRNTSMIAMGFWSETESDVANQVRRLPNNILSSQPIKEDVVIMNGKDSLANNIYQTLIPVLKIINDNALCPIDKFNYTKICELIIAPKQNSSASPLNLSMYAVSSKELKDLNYFFLMDEKKEVAAYARFTYTENSKYIERAYGNLPFITLEAIESKKRFDYSLGAVLLQAVFEQSLNRGDEGRIILYSANKTGEVYFKYGFIPLQETLFEKLFFNGEKELDGGIMFLTNSVISAWQERVNAQRILPNTVSSELEPK